LPRQVIGLTTPRASPMTKTQVEVIMSVQRRRRWSRAEKERIVAAPMEPGAVAFEIVRAAGIHNSQLFRWRQQFCDRAQIAVAFNAVATAPAPEPGSVSLIVFPLDKMLAPNPANRLHC
jgi:transposase